MKAPAFLKRKEVAPKTAWEAGFGKLMTPLEHFVKGETNSGMLLVICTAIALVIANSPLLHPYEELLATHIRIGSESVHIELSLHHWINDGLMTLFFFLVGLEIKREVLVGELSDFRKALLPVCAAVGGMVVPALLYFVFNTSGPGAAGWGIPMATDIAFAVLGHRRPKTLLTFLIALAIVDDIGAVLVIALFYTSDLHVMSLVWAGATFAVMMLCNRAGVRHPWVYLVCGVMLWILMHHSGIHATIAGIIAALAIPARAKYVPKIFAKGARRLLDKFDAENEKEESADVLRNTTMTGVLQTLEHGINKAQSPLQNLEHAHHLPVNFLIIPLFALANAAIPVTLDTLSQVMADPITLGVMFGLVLGKPIGVTLATWLAIKVGLCEMPTGMNIHHVIGAGFLAGIGFTMSIFITELAFAGDKTLLIHAKTGILFASILAAVLGFVYLLVLHRVREARRAQHTNVSS